MHTRYRVAAEELNNELGDDFVAVYNKTMNPLFANHEADPRKHSRNEDRWINEFKLPLSAVFHSIRKGCFESDFPFQMHAL